jgi:ribosomal 50S subunit-recycling heat shock protein
MTQRLKQWLAARVFKRRIPTLSDEDLGRIAMADAGVYSGEAVFAAWEKLAARAVIVEFVEQQAGLNDALSGDLVTVATFRNYVKAQFAQTRLLTSGMQAFLFDDNTIRVDGFLSTALGYVKLRVPAADVVEALEMLRPEPSIQVS